MTIASPARCFARIAISSGVLALAISLRATTYYIDALSGDDGNDGITTATAWRTIARVNAASFQSGDSVLFKGGETHAGNLVLGSDDSGTQASPVLVGSYGDGRAAIYASGGDGIRLTDTSYVTLAGLDVAGPGWNIMNDGSRGVALTGAAHHCVVMNLTARGFHKAGVLTENTTHDNTIVSVTAEQNGYIGIHVSGDNQFVSDSKALANQGDITVTNNWSGSGILVDDASYVTVEYCEAAFNGAQQPWTGNGPVGIWCWNTDHVTFRHCISHHNVRGAGSTDGGGFDLDGGTTDSLIEHCYSYANKGPGFMVYNFKYLSIPNRNNTVRYCVSENDAQGGIYLGTSGVALENIEIHNVTAFNTNGARVLYNGGGTKKNVNLRNNLLLTSGKLTINGNGINLQGNCYFSTSGAYAFGSYGGNFASWAAATGDEMLNGTLVGLKTDPQLLDVGHGTQLTDPRQLASLRSYSAAYATSPIIDAGLDLPGLFGLDPGSADLIGATIPVGAFDMGAYEYHPAPPPDTTPPAVAFAAPLDGATVSGGVTISANASDDATGTGVAGIQFKLDGTNLGGEVAAAPYSIQWDTTGTTAGTHTLTAVARDAAGNTATANITVTVSAPVTLTVSTEPITLDNADASGVTLSPGWSASTSVSGYYKTNYLHAAMGSNCSARFTPTIPQAGTYDVYLRWTAHTNRARNAPVDVTHAGGTTSFSIDMHVNGGKWMLLGTFTFSAGTAGNVIVRTAGANGYVVADAVQFVPR